MILLVGHGYVGSAIHEYFVKNNIDHAWANHHQVLDEVDFNGVVVNAAGYTGVPNVDTCEFKKAETIDGNVVFPVKLHERLRRARVIHIGSGCIYNGDRWFSEAQEPNFTFSSGGSFYSGCKAYAETLIKDYIDQTNSVILRIRMPFDSVPNSKNLLTKFERYDKIVDVTNSMSRLSDVCRIVGEFATDVITIGGVFNCTNQGSVSHRHIIDMMGLKKTMVDTDTFNRELIVASRSHCTLSVEKLSLHTRVPHVLDALQTTVEEYNRLADR